MNKIWIYIKSILIPLLIGVIIAFITGTSLDYTNLEKPLLSPPSILFPMVWTILYVLMGVSYARLKIDDKIDDNINFIYYLQLVLNAAWSIIFFSFKWRLFAFIWIVLLFVSIIRMIKEFYKKDKIAGLLQIPYLIWVLFASYLNLSIYLLNI